MRYLQAFSHRGAAVAIPARCYGPGRGYDSRRHRLGSSEAMGAVELGHRGRSTRLSGPHCVTGTPIFAPQGWTESHPPLPVGNPRVRAHPSPEQVGAAGWSGSPAPWPNLPLTRIRGEYCLRYVRPIRSVVPTHCRLGGKTARLAPHPLPSGGYCVDGPAMSCSATRT
mgnify:CR=1 FL=1